MKRILLLVLVVYISGCAPAAKNAAAPGVQEATAAASGSPASQSYEFPVLTLNSLTVCSSNICTFAVKVMLPEKELPRLTCAFQPKGLDIEPIMMDPYEKPQTIVGDIVLTTVSKICRTTGKPDAMTINCGRGSFAWSTPLDTSDPAVAQLIYRSISEQVIFTCRGSQY